MGKSAANRNRWNEEGLLTTSLDTAPKDGRVNADPVERGEEMKIARLFFILMFSLSAGCAMSQHKVDKDALIESKQKVYHIARVEIPCHELAGFPWPPFRNDKDYQLNMLEKIPIDALRKVLAEKYVLNTAQDDELITKSSPRNALGLITESYGRCQYKENSKLTEDGDIINVAYTANGMFVPPFPAQITMGYKIIVKSAGKEVITHKGSVEELSLSFLSKSAWDDAPNKLLDAATKIAEALQRDINKVATE